MVVRKTANRDDVKRAEAIAMVDKAIDKLVLFKSQLIEGTTTVEDISINNRLIGNANEVTGTFNINVDIDYTLSPFAHIVESNEQDG
ncbi:TPA: hypothetical protein ONV50_002046 [Enterococcus faecium]|jgi:hypothetical protein|uniref:Uncharacterized protein n=1 Tax=Enterococcus faecium TaxID=1352 RepID=A0AAW8RL69_ENTFC|nr:MULTISPECIES: hypothetical protein [Enterococcus]KAB5915690.1 hypothetical protein GA614_09910 [Bifidobacterium adolescentis]CAJ1858475.1 hypothetical protein AUSP0057_00035 [uncultured phage]AQT56845.1 hypothetical protein BVA20_01394 [Enterococcus faecium]AQY28068.1 hypothetical protein B4W80_03555 [Enterococcus faecium]AQY33155.1 hypothetical protein B4W81_14770 [Enterococcus faecium]